MAELLFVRTFRSKLYALCLFQFLLCFLLPFVSIIPQAQCQTRKDHQKLYTLHFSDSSLAPMVRAARHIH